MMIPLISIGITAYNAQASIANAVASALAQDWNPAEIIIVDDASTDNTASILEQLQKTYPELRIIRHEVNKGVAAARNTIINNARGDFLAFFDDDDKSDSQRLKKQYLRIISYEEKFAGGREVLCHSARIQIYPDGRQHYEPTAGCDPDNLSPFGYRMAERILYGKPLENGFGSMATCSQMARVKTYQLLHGFDEEFKRCEDTDFTVRFALRGGHFVGISEPLVQQTMTYGNDKSLDMEELHHHKLIDKHAIFIRNSGMPPTFCHLWLDAKYAYVRRKKFSFGLQMQTLFFRHPRLTLKRLLWALPNREYYDHARTFYKDAS